MTPNTRELATPGHRTFERSSRIARLFRSAGTARRATPRFEGLDTLENRILLGGDHPSFALPLSVANSTVLTLDANGRANDTGVLSPEMDDDLFSFVAPADDFVTVWADTLNTASPSALDSRIEVYAADATIVASGSSSDLLTGGFNDTGWAGFVATGGETYFVRVMSDVFTGTGATGDYVVRVDAKTDPISISGSSGRASGSTDIVLPGEDLVFSMTTPVGDAFDSLATFYGDADPDLFDARVDVYGPDGQRITFDSEAGRLSNPYAVARTQQDTMYYVRVRGDHFEPTDPLSLGSVTMNADFAATLAPIDPVNRQIFSTTSTSGTDRAEGVLISPREASSFSFDSFGTGLHVITIVGVQVGFASPLDSPAVHLYDDDGIELAFNRLGGAAEIQIQLNAGRRYHVVVESFDNFFNTFQPEPFGRGVGLFVEAHHTWNQGIVAGPVDDHINLPDLTGGIPEFGSAAYQQLLNEFTLATPIIWSDPQLLISAPLPTAPNGIVQGDKSYFVRGLARGRIHESGDSDLFMFVPPVDVLGQFGGNDDNNGSALFLGGQGNFTFKATTPSPNFDPIVRPNIGIWDARDYWPVGGDFNGAVRAMAAWDPDGAGGERAMMVVGGDFTDIGGVPFDHIAAWRFNALFQRFEWFDLGGADGVVNAITTYTVPGGGNPPSLMIGGSFTTVGAAFPQNLAIGDWNGAGVDWAAVAGGTNGPVYALSIWDPDQADPFGDLGVVVGGDFTAPSSNVTLVMPSPLGGLMLQDMGGGTNGPVYALHNYTFWDTDPEDPLSRSAIYVGGDFSQVGGATSASNLAAFFVYNDDMQNLVMMWKPAGAGTNGPVYALEVWDRDGDDEVFADQLAIGGNFTSPGAYVAAFQSDENVQAMSQIGGMNAPVRTLHAFIDQEYDTDLGQIVEEPVLYAGGEFTLADGIEANRLASFKLLGDYFWFAMSGDTGKVNGTDNTVFTLASMNDEIAGQWDRDERHATRVAMLLFGTTESFVNTFISVYDSNFTLIYTNDTIFPPLQDPSGMNDLSLSPLLGFEGIQVWGGETYYVEVTSLAATGRYTLSITTDAYAPDGKDVISIFSDPPGAGEWFLATEIPLSTFSGGTGDGHTFIPSPFAAFNGRRYEITPSGILISQVSELGNIDHVLDTDLYKFRAPADGTAEIRIATMAIEDDSFESITNLVEGSTTTNFLQKTYNSTLDSHLRIYNNDFELIAEGDFNPAVKGGMEFYSTGDFDRWFTHRDAYVVIEVLAGEEFFIEVSSGQATAFAADPGSVEWRTAIGGYDLMINTMPNLFPLANPNTGIPDDHANVIGTGLSVSQSTVIPIDAALGAGSIIGVIDTHFANPFDIDFFQFIAPAVGIASITVTPTGSSSLNLSMTIFNGEGFQIAVGNAPGVGLPLTLGVPAVQGDQFYVAIDAGTEEGLLSYRVDVSGMPFSDDHANVGEWPDATELEILDFLGIATQAGSIEAPGDTDVFVFDTLVFDIADITVTSLDPAFDPIVRVFEVQEDPAGNPVLLQVAFNDNEPSSLNSRTFFPLTEPQRTSLFTGNTYNKYFISVSGVDPEADFGDYVLRLQITPTDDHADDTQFEFASSVIVDPLFGTGAASGILEISGDTDLFQFIAPAGGLAAITVLSDGTSTLRPSLWVYDASFNRLTDLTSGQQVVTGDDATVSTATFSFTAVRNQTYFFVIGGVSGGSVTVDNGSYSVSIEAPTADDHANRSEFILATQILLSAETGDGAAVGTIGQENDTDLFFFETLVGDDYVISIDAAVGAINPIVELFDLSQTSIAIVVDGGAGDEDGMRNGSVVTTITAGAAGEIYYVLVSSDPLGLQRTGDYAVAIDGEPPTTGPGPINDDHADAGEFSLATVIPLSLRTGDGLATGTIELSGDTDLFRFTSLASGEAFVQIVAPDGSLLDAELRVYNQAEQLIRFDSEGVPGAEASTSFPTTGVGQVFYLEVGGVGSSFGSYSVRVNTAPETFHLYFPEGFANPDIREFVSLANPNTFEVTYEITLYYEDTELAPVTVTPVGGARLSGGARGGITLSGFGSVLDGITPDEPYSIEITSNGPLGATFAHYDFGLALGESFTETASTVWSFASVTRQPGAVNDFLVFFNPNPTDVLVTMTAFTSRGQVVLEQILGGNRRGGWDIASTSPLPTETFGVVITSAPVDPNDSHIGIVASLSHFDTNNRIGYSVLGNSSGGATRGVVASLENTDAVTPLVSLFNAGPSVVSVTLRSSYTQVALPDVVKIVEIQAGETIALDAAGLGLTSNQPVGLRYDATGKVTVLAIESFAGEADATQTGTDAGMNFFFGDAFINTASAGTKYLETLGFYNPSGTVLTVDVNLFFLNGDTATTQVTLDADGFATLKLHELNLILDRGGLQFFAIEVSAGSPFIVEMTHYDLFLGGGWSTGGAPLGLLNSLSSMG